MRTWPDDWEARRRGDGCPACGEGRPDEIPEGIRIFAGRLTDAYLNTNAIARGYTVAFWRGRHVAEPTELNDDELCTFAREVQLVASAIEAVYLPAKLNYLVLGNSLPHLHTHIVPRYLDDPDPGRPPRFMMGNETRSPMPEANVRRQLEEMRSVIAGLRVRA